MGSAGNLYGTTPVGGINDCEGSGCGVVFKVDPSGHETVLHTFRCGTDGWSPQAGLAIDADGNLYGAVIYGGTLAIARGCRGRRLRRRLQNNAAS